MLPWPIMHRIGWWLYRREQGHPISLWRTLFGNQPRFGSYEANEEGCPEWAKKDYELIK